MNSTYAFDTDVFRIRITRQVDVRIFTEGTIDTTGRLYDRLLILRASDDQSGSGDNFLILYLINPGTYYIAVRGFLGIPVGAYTLTVQTNTTDIHGDTAADATPISLDAPINGELHSGDVDFFRINVASRTDVSIFTSGNADTVGEVYDGSLTLLAFDDDAGGSNNFRILERLDPGTTYYIAVRGFSASSVGSYTLTIQMENYNLFSCPPSEFDDPLYGCQWHLKNTGQNVGATAGEDINVESVWATYKGNGIHIAVVDGGMHFAHEDLKDNVDTALNHDYTPETPSIYAQNDNHGTAVSGLIAARDNGLGVRGVAPRATIYGYNLIDNDTAINEADAMTRNRVETVISNNSWGPPDSIVAFDGPARVWEMAIETGVNEGSDGKGIVYVWAGGNGARIGDNSNYDGYANYYAVTAVCAVSDQGIRNSRSEQGANLWVCAPSSDDDRGRQGIVTTDNAHRYRDDFGDTSAATPIVSGVVALVRQANPELSWRDVKLVLAASARRNDLGNSGWQNGAVQYGALERYTFNHEYGFGVVDAQAAVDLAQDWKNVPPMKTDASAIISVNQIIPDNSSVEITSSLQIASDIDFIEFVEINVDFNHPRFTDLDMRLISPSGAVSELIVNEGRSVLVARGSWRFGSARHLGEDPSGIWQLAVVDRAAGFSGTLNSWSLKIYGHSNPAVMIVFTEVPTEENLDGSALTVTITDAVWNNPLAVADFSLVAAPAGVSIAGVERNTDTMATLTLAFDGTDFDDNAEISITVLAGAHSGNGNLVGEPTITVTANHEATGEPLIGGIPQVGAVLTATSGSINDEDGLSGVRYSRQWQVSSDRSIWIDIEGANTEDLIPLPGHQDQFLRVVVSFADDAGFMESRASASVGPVLGPLSVLVTVPVTLTEINLDSSALVMTITNAVWNAPLAVTDFSLAGAPTGVSIMGVERNTDTMATLTLAFDGTDFDDNAEISITVLAGAHNRSGNLVGEPTIIVTANHEATGEPLIEGISQVGAVLTATGDSINDEDGLSGVSYSWRWQVSDDGNTWTDIPGANTADFMPTLTHQDQFLRVVAVFTDDDGFRESRTSTSVGPVLGPPSVLVTVSATLTEINLDGSTLVVTITDVVWSTPLEVADFSLAGAPAGVSIMGVERNTDTTATLTLAFDGTDFDSDMAIGVTVLATAHSGTTDLVSRLITITANQEENYDPFVCPTSEFDDPLYGCQWHLENNAQYNGKNGRYNGKAGEDINVKGVWGTYKGEGIHIAVVDDGMYFAHEDLKDNVDESLNHNYESSLSSIYNPNVAHGTAVSGLIAARDENGLGVRGVAPRATIYGYNLLVERTDINEADAMTRNRMKTAVSSNSWGPPDSIVAFDGPARVWERAIETGVNEGYDGKGIVYVWAAGNGARRGDNSNYDGYVNYYAVTAVCAVNNRGIRSSYSEQGANLWVCAPSSDYDRDRQGIVTTDNEYSNATTPGYRDDFGGTSAAAPIVSGVVALVRQANPELSWRDVKLVLAASARRNDPGNSGWEDGAVQYGAASERYTFNHEYGFGVVDAQAAVDLAQDWKNVPPMKTAKSGGIAVNQNIPDNSPAGITHSIEITSDIDFIEFVDINVDFDHHRFTDLDMRLISPSGAVSELIVYKGGRSSVATGSWRFGSVRHLGEDPSGIWQLAVVDQAAMNRGTLYSWSLKIYGHSSPAVMIVFTEVPTEENLDGSTLVMTITDAVWSTSLVVADFSLAAAPAGVSIMGVERNTDTMATLTLAFDGTDFDDNAEISIAVLETAHSGNGNLVGEPTITVTANHEAAGEPSITGTPQVGIPLTATIGSITDGNGLNTANYAWQWQVSDDGNTWTDIPGANTADFIPALTHQDQFLRVVAGFTDDDGFRESPTSTSVDPVLAPPLLLISVPTALTEANLNGFTLILTLAGEVWNNPLSVTDFSLVNIPSGLSIADIVRNTDTIATLTLAFDGTDFDDNAKISITVLETAHSGNGNLVGEPMIIVTANHEAAGEPSITGTLRVGFRLTATKGSITDGNGLNTANYAWQWQVSDDGNTWTDIPGADTEDLIPLPGHQGEFLRVVVSFADDVGFMESRASTSVGPVLGPPSVLVTAAVTLTEINLDGSTLVMTITDAVWNDPLAVADFSLTTAPAGVSIMGVERNTDTTAMLTLAFGGTDFDSDMAIGVTVLATAHSGTIDLVSRLIIITANQEASGEPSITGTPQVGIQLTATIGSITDGNGLNAANYAWQWQVSDDGNTWTDIPGANTADFIPALIHQDQFLRVVASFTDDDGFRESRTNTSVGLVSNDSFATATTITLGVPISSEIHSGDDVDYFRIEIASTVDVSIFTEGATDTTGQLYDNLFTLLAFDDQSGSGNNFRIRERLYPGTYYIAVRGFRGLSVGAYTLTLQMENTSSFVCPASEFDDPLYGCQWHLKNTGQNGATAGEDIKVESVWKTYKGNGIHIAVVDRGMHFAHDDLKENVDTALNYDYTPETPSIYVHDNNHGTAVSGLIAARDENGLGVRGVAPRATIYGYNLLDKRTDINEADAMMRNRVETVVSSNSWGPPDSVRLEGPARVWEMAIETGVSEGSDGKGIVYVWAGGNGAGSGDNSNYDGYANYYAVTAVCAVNDRGIRSGYSEQGANLWVCAPSDDSNEDRQGIVTTDNAHHYIDDFGGTSAATPIVSGVVALVRQANPELSWRDVKLVLAASARKNDPDNAGWQDGAVQYGAAPERYTFNHEYGFGVVDAQAAVDLAQDWKNVPSMKTAASTTLSVNQIIPDNSPIGITHSLQIASDIDFIEFVEINVDFDHDRFIDLDMRLISPSSAVSELIVNSRDRPSSVPTGSWRFGSARHLGEDPSGIWQLEVVDRVAGDEGTLNSWSLKIYGHSSPIPAVMIISTEVPTEENLDGSTLVMTITDAVWSTSLAVADFSLVAAPAGVSIMGVERNTDTTATLTLAFDGTDFDSDMAIGVTVLATAHSGTIDLVSRLITIIANQEASGEPSITGTPQVSIPLIATIGSITDGNGLNTANYAWQWQVSTNRNTWTDIPGANTADFIPALTHQDQFLRVCFTDDDGFRESRTNTSMDPVLAPPLLLISVPTINACTSFCCRGPLSVTDFSLVRCIADIVERNTDTTATFAGTDFDVV